MSSKYLKVNLVPGCVDTPLLESLSCRNRENRARKTVSEPTTEGDEGVKVLANSCTGTVIKHGCNRSLYSGATGGREGGREGKSIQLANWKKQQPLKQV